MGGDHSKNVAADLSGKVCLITGANSGIGYITAREIARLKAHVIMACRNKQRGEDALKKIKTEVGEDCKVELMLVDLSSLESVRDFVKEFKSKSLPLHILINNAAILNQTYAKTIDGIEMQLGTNHMGPFLLTLSLLEVLKASAPSRIVNVASGLYTGGKLDFSDINLEKKGAFAAMSCYKRTKLCNILFTYELARRLQGTKVAVNAVHPGFVSTELTRDSGAFVKAIVKASAKSPVQGAQTSVYIAASPDVEGQTGKYYAKCQEQTTNSMSHDQDLIQKLWDLSLKLTGLTDDILPPPSS